MFKTKGRFQQLLKEYHRPLRKMSTKGQDLIKPPSNFKLQRVLIVMKFSRLEFEQLRNPQLNQEQLKKKLQNRGTDYDKLVCNHNLHKRFEEKVVKSFVNAGVEVKKASRLEFRSTLSKDVIEWADLIVPIGGDGTFLLTAGRASPLYAQQRTPIVGFNSNSERSEGRLLLPQHFSAHPDDAVARLKKGAFDWIFRSRIRTSFLGNNGKIPQPSDVYRHTLIKMEQNSLIKTESLSPELANKYDAKYRRVLPYLGLNEVFIGENLSARVTHLHIVTDGSNVVNKTKCSGLCVSTGTGSTSWHQSINRISKHHIEDLLKVLPAANTKNLNVDQILKDYNENLKFPPDDPRLCYTVREQIHVRVWPQPQDFKARQFVQTLYVRSLCFAATLVIDGSISYPFNDGAKVLLEVHPEDALLTIQMD